MNGDFSRALPFTLQHEGGDVDDRLDRGGRTSRGITQKTYDGACIAYHWKPGDVFLATDAQVEMIYRKRFWERVRGDDLPWPLCLALFDTGVLHGTGFAIRRLQAVVGETPDGIFGFRTMAGVQATPVLELTRDFLQLRDDRYEELVRADPTQKRFFRNWEHRCDELCDACGVPRTLDP